jgi:cob(I)alamin adenosyltransferase
MKIYTKTGDQGLTSLFGGKRVSKDDIRIEAYGTVDELNSFIGLLRDSIDIEDVRALLLIIQSRLFDCGAILATDPDKNIIASNIVMKDIELLENTIDNYNAELEELRSFILPGGSESISRAHVCRVISRRAERRVVSLQKIANVPQELVIYLNRLSDYFFILARYLSNKERVEEIKWQARK